MTVYATCHRHPSSFRDPEGFVFFERGVLKRKILTVKAQERMRVLLEAPFYMKELSALTIPTHWEGDDLLHERVPVLTYPYEWSFNMLKDAALGQLKLLEICVKNNFILKDGSAFNTLFHQRKMVFVDLLSIDTYQEGQMWEGYHQFCRHFLFPLMLKSHKKINFHPWWRGTSDGFSLEKIQALFSFSEFYKPGVGKHIFLQHLLSKSVSKEINIRKNFSQKIFPKEALLSMIKNLRKTVSLLKNDSRASVWKNYVTDNSYDRENTQHKEQFIVQHFSKNAFQQIVDLGCNTGHYARLVSQYASRVIAADFDADCVDAVYLKMKEEGTATLVPMVSDLMNPSPAQGWVLREREDQITRLKSDAFLALALIHHICITHNVPVPFFVGLLAQLAPCGVVEWVDSSDPMVQILLKNRTNIFEDYHWDHFKHCLEKHFKIEDIQEVNNGTRKLCFATSL